MKIIDESLLSRVGKEAQESPRLRKNYNFHQSLDDRCHRFLNALLPGTVIPIHHHPTKDESFILLKGKVRVLTYDDDGNVLEDVVLSQADGRYGVDIPKNTWHTIEVIDNAILFEVKEGPFIPHEQEELIKTSIDEFKSKRDWYIKNNIPYHFGFLLYGEGGTGKTTLAQCIADYADAQLISFPGDSIAELPKILGGPIPTSSIDPSVYRIILIEDIDCGFAQRAIDTFYDEDNDEFKSKERKVGLASILNTLDGLAAPTNVIYVFTTNHIEKLDPALIRPGRCDVRLNIPGVTVETFTRFCKYHNYDTDRIKEITDDEIRSDVTFAELQTQVMKGDTIEDLIKLIKK
jgi:cupin fold WbuC family metalloprotein